MTQDDMLRIILCRDITIVNDLSPLILGDMSVLTYFSFSHVSFKAVVHKSVFLSVQIYRPIYIYLLNLHYMRIHTLQINMYVYI